MSYSTVPELLTGIGDAIREKTNKYYRFDLNCNKI